jgi:hypothetical protein
VLFVITSVIVLLIFGPASVFSSVGPFTVSCVSPLLLVDLNVVQFPAVDDKVAFFAPVQVS